MVIRQLFLAVIACCGFLYSCMISASENDPIPLRPSEDTSSIFHIRELRGQVTRYLNLQDRLIMRQTSKFWHEELCGPIDQVLAPFQEFFKAMCLDHRAEQCRLLLSTEFQDYLMGHRKLSLAGLVTMLPYRQSDVLDNFCEYLQNRNATELWNDSGIPHTLEDVLHTLYLDRHQWPLKAHLEILHYNLLRNTSSIAGLVASFLNESPSIHPVDRIWTEHTLLHQGIPESNQPSFKKIMQDAALSLLKNESAPARFRKEALEIFCKVAPAEVLEAELSVLKETATGKLSLEVHKLYYLWLVDKTQDHASPDVIKLLDHVMATPALGEPVTTWAFHRKFAQVSNVQRIERGDLTEADMLAEIDKMYDLAQKSSYPQLRAIAIHGQMTFEDLNVLEKQAELLSDLEVRTLYERLLEIIFDAEAPLRNPEIPPLDFVNPDLEDLVKRVITERSPRLQQIFFSCMCSSLLRNTKPILARILKSLMTHKHAVRRQWMLEHAYAKEPCASWVNALPKDAEKSYLSYMALISTMGNEMQRRGQR